MVNGNTPVVAVRDAHQRILDIGIDVFNEPSSPHWLNRQTSCRSITVL